MLFAVQEIREISVKLLKMHGVDDDAALLQSDLLIEAELRDLPSHGLQRLPRLLRRIDAGLADPAATGRLNWRAPAMLHVDGARGLGPVVTMATINAMRPAVAANGLCIAGIRDANHIGMLAYYAEAAADMGLISVILSTSEALVHPFGGTKAMLGTNPIAIGVPTAAEPFILDLATGLVSMGKIHHHALTGTPIPADWAVDAEGQRTTDPVAAKSGAIAPFGEAKGYGLGLGFELLVAALAGSALAPDVRGTLDDTQPANKGDVILLIDPARSGAGDGIAQTLAAYLDDLRRSRPANPARPVQVPGDGARARHVRNLAGGIDLPPALQDELAALLAA